MSNYYITGSGLVSEEELKHYGVIGMKWGVRRGNTAKAYSKASKKFDKLSKKADKKQTKANKKLAKAQKAMYGWSNRNRQRAKWKAGRAQFKADKITKKAARWFNKMETVFANTDVKLTSAQIEAGKLYTNRLMKRTDASNMSFL